MHTTPAHIPIRSSRTRDAILHLLGNVNLPVGISYIKQHLDVHADTATLYRNIELLVKKGQVLSIDLGHGHEHFFLPGRFRTIAICSCCLHVMTANPPDELPIPQEMRTKFACIYASTQIVHGLCITCSGIEHDHHHALCHTH